MFSQGDAATWRLPDKRLGLYLLEVDIGLISSLGDDEAVAIWEACKPAYRVAYDLGKSVTVASEANEAALLGKGLYSPANRGPAAGGYFERLKKLAYRQGSATPRTECLKNLFVGDGHDG